MDVKYREEMNHGDKRQSRIHCSIRESRGACEGKAGSSDYDSGKTFLDIYKDERYKFFTNLWTYFFVMQWLMN